MIKSLAIRPDLLLFLGSVALFALLPELDLTVSRWFYDPALGDFHMKHYLLFDAVYELFGRIHLLLLALLPVLAVLGYRRYRQDHQRRWIGTFLLLSLLLGPGLIANTVLKNNSTGRARPVQVEQFGGTRQYTEAFAYSGQCRKNCSFVSGHAAIGFYFIALGWLRQSRRAFWAGCTIGGLVALTRIAQGAHFLSDTVFAFWVVYGVNLALMRWLGLAHPLRSDGSRRIPEDPAAVPGESG